MLPRTGRIAEAPDVPFELVDDCLSTHRRSCRVTFILICWRLRISLSFLLIARRGGNRTVRIHLLFGYELLRYGAVDLVERSLVIRPDAAECFGELLQVSLIDLERDVAVLVSLELFTHANAQRCSLVLDLAEELGVMRRDCQRHFSFPLYDFRLRLLHVELCVAGWPALRLAVRFPHERRHHRDQVRLAYLSRLLILCCRQPGF